jgi:uncharacterized protein
MGPAAQHQAFLDAGELRLQRSRTSGRWLFEPRVGEPGSADEDLEWTPVSGLGTVYAVTVVRPRPPAEAYPVVLVDLDEGVRVMSTVIDAPLEAIAIGLRVMARVVQADGRGKLVFTPLPADSTTCNGPSR